MSAMARGRLRQAEHPLCTRARRFSHTDRQTAGPPPPCNAAQAPRGPGDGCKRRHIGHEAFRRVEGGGRKCPRRGVTVRWVPARRRFRPPPARTRSRQPGAPAGVDGSWPLMTRRSPPGTRPAPAHSTRPLTWAAAKSMTLRSSGVPTRSRGRIPLGRGAQPPHRRGVGITGGSQPDVHHRHDLVHPPACRSRTGSAGRRCPRRAASRSRRRRAGASRGPGARHRG